MSKKVKTSFYCTKEKKNYPKGEKYTGGRTDVGHLLYKDGEEAAEKKAKDAHNAKLAKERKKNEKANKAHGEQPQKKSAKKKGETKEAPETTDGATDNKDGASDK